MKRKNTSKENRLRMIYVVDGRHRKDGTEVI